MFKSDSVILSLFTRVGWRQPTQVDYAILTGDNLVSKSGLYFGDYHKAITVKNIKNTVEDEAISNVDFNTHLINLQKAAINRVLQGIFNKNVVIEQLRLFSRDDEDNFVTLPNESKFVGLRIKPPQDSSYSLIINSLSLYFTENKTFDIYCYHTVKGELWKKSVTVVANQETIITLNEILSVSSSTYKDGEFMIGYYQSDLGTCQAIDSNEALDGVLNAVLFDIEGFEANVSGGKYVKENISYNSNDYGINAEITGQRDFTNLICSNAQMFDEAVGLQMAVDVIEQIIFSTRSNSTERISKEQLGQLYNDLNLDMPNDEMPYSAGLKNRLKRELQKISKNIFPKDQPTIC